MNESARPASTYALGAAVLGGALLGCTRLGALDLPLMLANGARILDTGAIPRTNVFSWVAPDHPYLNDKWLFMVLVAAVDRVAGALGLAALKAAFGGAMAGALFALGRRRTGTAAGAALLGATMLSYRLHLRAEWVSYLGVVATLLLVPGIRAGRRAPTALAVLVVPVWAASHGYWVLGPLLVAAAALGARSLRAAVVAVSMVAAAAVSPFGLANVLHPFRVLAQLGGGGPDAPALGDAITELRLPFSGAAPVTFFHLLAMGLTVLGGVFLVRAVRRREFATGAVLLVLLLVSWRLDRNLALLGVVPALGVGATARRTPWLVAGVLAVVVATVGTALGVERIAVDRRFGVGAHEGRFPVQLLARQPAGRAGERYVNDLSLGSWLVRRRGSAFIDGNTEGVSAAFLARYRRLLSGEEPVAAIEAEFHPDGWLLRTSAATTRVVVLGLFLDGTCAPDDWDDVATLFRPAESVDVREEHWRTWLRDVYLPRARAWFPAADEARSTAARSGARGDVALLREALRLSPWERVLYRDLADAYAARGAVVEAARCRVWAARLTE